MPDTTCPLCNKPANSITLQSFDGQRVTCETCGEYDISGLIVSVQVKNYTDPQGNNKVGDRSYILSGLTRRASDAGERTVINENNISTLLQSVAIPKNPLENMDMALLYVGEHQSKADEFFEVFHGKDYPLTFAKDEDECRYFLQTLVERKLLDHQAELVLAGQPRSDSYRLTPEGWEKAEQIKNLQPDSNQAFVAIWFSAQLSDAWEQGFKPALESTGFDPLRVDLAEHNGKIDDFIIAQIRRSGLLVADFTGHRGGVYFEAGFAMGLGIPVIWTCRKSDINELHFDTRQYNHIDWENPQELKERLQNRIAATIPGRSIAN